MKKCFVKIISLLLVLIIVLTTVIANIQISSATSDEEYRYTKDGMTGFVYTINNGEIIIESRWLKDEFVVPESIDGLPVTSINCSGDGHWNGISVERYIDTVIYIPVSVKEVVGNGTKKFVVDEANPYLSSDEHGVLFDKNKETLISYPIANIAKEYIVPDSVKYIAENAFRGAICLENLVLNEGLLEIGLYSVAETISLKTVNIPSTVTSVHNSSFTQGLALESITVDENNQYYSSDEYGVLFDKAKTKLMQYPAAAPAESYVIPEGVTDFILDWYGPTLYPFAGVHYLKEITIPASVTSVMHFASYMSFFERINVSPNHLEYKSVDGVVYNKDGSELVNYPGGSKETCLVVPNGVTSFGYRFDHPTHKYLASIVYNNEMSENTTPIEDGEEYSNSSSPMLTDVYFMGDGEAYERIAVNTYYDKAVTYHYNCKPDDHFHDYEFEITKSPDCSHSGEALLTCSCGKTLTAKVNAVGTHNFVSELVGFSYEVCCATLYECNGLVCETCEIGSYIYFSSKENPDEFDISTTFSPSEDGGRIGTSVCNFCEETVDTVYIKDGYKAIVFKNNGWDFVAKAKPGNPVNVNYVPVSEDKIFLGWSTDSNATSPEFISSNIITVTEDTVLYPVWSKIAYTLSYDVNGGSGNITEQTGDVAYTIGSTVPLRSGYNFLGWSTDKTSTTAEYVPGDSIILTEDTVLYAVWAKRSYLLTESDIFSFVNSRSNFKTGTYTMTDSDFIKLTDYISKLYNAKTAATYINRLQVARSDAWGGSCFGMSMSVILNKTGQIDFVENFDPSAANMYGVARPYQNEAVQSAINYYQISQRVNGFRTTTYTIDKGNFSTGLEKLVNTVKDGNMTLLIYSWPEGCHAIVIVGYEKAEDGGHNLIAYDNRYGSKYINVYVDEGYNTCIVNGKEEAYYVEFNTNFSIFNKIDIDGPGNDMVFTSSSESIGTEIGIKLNGNITIKNAEGETLTVNNGIIDGDMEVLSSYVIVNSTVDNPVVPGTLMLKVEDSDSFTFDSTADEISASLSTDECYAEVTATADEVVISEDEGIYTTGDDIEFNGWLSLNNDMGDVINFEGQGNNEVNFLYSGDDDIIIEGANDESTVTVYSDLVDVDEVTFSSDYETLNISGEKDDIAITASSKNNGIFDVNVAGIGNAKFDVKIVAPSTSTINCGDSIILHADISDIPEGGYVKWTASNDCFTYTVSEDGSTCKITSESNGSTVFTVTIYDAEDNAVSKAEQIMNSKAGFFLKIIAFFKKLFGLTKTIPQIYKDIF